VVIYFTKSLNLTLSYHSGTGYRLSAIVYQERLQETVVEQTRVGSGLEETIEEMKRASEERIQFISQKHLEVRHLEFEVFL
jgi:hypothetical protein